MKEYSSIRQRLLNSEALLEDMNLALYTINETTLVSIYVLCCHGTGGLCNI